MNNTVGGYSTNVTGFNSPSALPDISENFDKYSDIVSFKTFMNDRCIQTFKRILDAADTHKCHRFAIYHFDYEEYSPKETCKILIDKIRSNPKYEARLYTEKDFEYFINSWMQMGYPIEDLKLFKEQEEEIYTCQYKG